MDIKIDEVSAKIVDSYPDKEVFVKNSIRIFDRLLNYILEVNGFYSEKQIIDNWNEIIKACDRVIDSIIENSFEKGYCSLFSSDHSLP